MKQLAVTGILLLVASCTLFEPLFKGGEVARAGRSVLYEEEIRAAVPAGVSGEDSLRAVRQYIRSWTLKRLLLQKAEEQLSKEEKDVSLQLEDYRTQLLIFRYENRFVQERLDTVISEEEQLRYYRQHSDRFASRNGIVRGCLIQMLNGSPALPMIRSLSGMPDPDGADELEEVARNTAFRYTDYEGKWIDLAVVSRDMGMDLAELQRKLARERVVEAADSSYTRILRVWDYLSPGTVSPYEYNEERIREIILSLRKQEMLAGLHRDIMDEASGSKNFKITENDKATD